MEMRELLGDAFGRLVEDFERAVDGLTPDELAYRPDPRANSIAWLAWHAARVQDDHVSELAHREQVWFTEGFRERFALALDPGDTGFGHTAEQVAMVRTDGPDLLDYLRAVTDRTLDYVGRIDGDELDRIVDRRWDPPVSVGVRLVSVIDDGLQHAGQAAYVRGLIERSP